MFNAIIALSVMLLQVLQVQNLFQLQVAYLPSAVSILTLLVYTATLRLMHLAPIL